MFSYNNMMDAILVNSLVYSLGMNMETIYFAHLFYNLYLYWLSLLVTFLIEI